MKKIILTNLVSLLLFIGIMLDAMFLSKTAAGILGIFWIFYVIYTNYVLFLKKTDEVSEIKKADRTKSFPDAVKKLIICYESIEQRREVFEQYPETNGMRRAFDLVDKQVQSNIKSAKQFMYAYDTATKPSTAYLQKLLADNARLTTKLSELVELEIRSESEADDVDTGFVDTFTDSLKDLLRETRN